VKWVYNDTVRLSTITLYETEKTMSDTAPAIDLTPVDDIEGATTYRASKWDKHVEAIEALASRAAKFVVTETGAELDKMKRAFRSAANKRGHTAKFGTDKAVDGGTEVQVKLVDKVAGRPAGTPNKTEAEVGTTPKAAAPAATK